MYDNALNLFFQPYSFSYNVCIMAYGQTGSGKTHTMVGDHGIYDDVSLDDLTQEYKQGIIPRAAKELIR